MPAFRRRFGDHASTLHADIPFELGNGRIALLASSLSIGAAIGCLVAAPIADRVGRKIPVQIGCAVYALGTVMQVVANSYIFLVIGRLVAGLGIGIEACAVA